MPALLAAATTPGWVSFSRDQRPYSIRRPSTHRHVVAGVLWLGHCRQRGLHLQSIAFPQWWSRTQVGWGIDLVGSAGLQALVVHPEMEAAGGPITSS